MTRYIARFCAVLILLVTSTILFAQQKKSRTDPPKKVVKQETKEEVLKDEIPPPVQEENTMGFDTTSVPDDELTRAIKSLMKITGAMDLSKQMRQKIIEIRQSNPSSGLPDEFYTRLLNEFENERTTRWMTNAIVRVYRQKFAVDEIKDIIAFYETPTGRKAVSLLPVIMQESMQQGELIGRYTGMKVYTEMVQEGKIKQ